MDEKQGIGEGTTGSGPDGAAISGGETMRKESKNTNEKRDGGIHTRLHKKEKKYWILFVP